MINLKQSWRQKMKNRILCLLCGTGLLFIIWLVNKIPHFIHLLLFQLLLFLVFLSLVYILGFLILIAVYNAQDKDVEPLVKDFLFWVERDKSQL